MKFLGEASLKKLLNLIKDKFDTKVDKVSDKGLSTNDYTTDEKTKLSKIETEANKYTLPVAGETLGGIKSGTDITVDASGNVSVNDDSHNHIISNIDGLQTALDGKSEAAHTHNYAGSDSVGGPANEVKNGIVTRAKLAQDALYSPNVHLGASNATFSISSGSVGKTFIANNSTTDFVITVPADTSIPTGFEIALLRFSCKSMKITFASGIKVLVYGNNSPLTAPTFNLETYAMVALKKISDSDYWLLTGPAEVVT